MRSNRKNGNHDGTRLTESATNMSQKVAKTPHKVANSVLQKNSRPETVDDRHTCQKTLNTTTGRGFGKRDRRRFWRSQQQSGTQNVPQRPSKAAPKNAEPPRELRSEGEPGVRRPHSKHSEPRQTVQPRVWSRKEGRRNTFDDPNRSTPPCQNFDQPTRCVRRSRTTNHGAMERKATPNLHF